MTHAKHLRNRGFTLVELLVVIGIIAALAGISMVAMSKISHNAREKVTRTKLAGLSAAIKDFLADDPQNINELPDESGGPFSSQELYELLTGDVNRNGKMDGDELIEAAIYRPLLPPRNENNKIDFTSSECMVRNFEQVNGVWQLVQEEEGELGANFAIVDAFAKPIRFWFQNRKGRKNNVDGSYDLWSGGQDGVTTSDASTAPTKANGMLDDLGNW